MTDLRSFDSKVVLIGDSGVGKTSLVLRYVQGTYDGKQVNTIGASFMTKKISVDDWNVKLQIWDTAGEEKFRSMLPMYYRGAGVALLAYDITNPHSFESVKFWVKELGNHVRSDIVIAIVGNKSDMESERKVMHNKSKEFADSIGAIFHETSAKNNEGLTELFAQVARELVKRHQAEKNKPAVEKSSGNLKVNNNGSGGSTCPC